MLTFKVDTFEVNGPNYFFSAKTLTFKVAYSPSTTLCTIVYIVYTKVYIVYTIYYTIRICPRDTRTQPLMHEPRNHTTDAISRSRNSTRLPFFTTEPGHS